MSFHSLLPPFSQLPAPPCLAMGRRSMRESGTKRARISPPPFSVAAPTLPDALADAPTLPCSCFRDDYQNAEMRVSSVMSERGSISGNKRLSN